MNAIQQVPSKSGVSHSVLRVSVGLAILLVAAAVAFYIVIVKAPSDLARNTAEGIRTLFNFTPQVKVGQVIVIEQNSPALEVATVVRDVFVDYSWSHTWLGSTKTIQLQGSFTAKAGFDLHRPFTITIRKNPLSVEAQLPPPRLLSLEMLTYHIVKDEGGWWNRISDSDRETAVLALKEAARQNAEASGILLETTRTAEARIRELVERNGSTVEFIENGTR